MFDFLVFIIGLMVFKDQPAHIMVYLAIVIIVYLIGIYHHVAKISKRLPPG